DDEAEPEPSPPPINAINNLPQISSPKKPDPLPPPPLDLLKPSNSRDLYDIEQGVRIRGFPHVEGNFALHVFIPVRIPSTARKLLASYVKKVASAVSGLYVVDVDFALNELCKDDQKLEQMLLGREFHISLGRTVPIQAHQINSIVAMLQQKFQSQRRYQIDFNKWDVFVNDDQTRSFISLEVTGEGLAEISRQIRVVDEIYRLHGLPEFYKNPRPHISLVWAPGHISVGLKKVVAELDRVPNRPSTSRKNLFSCRFSAVECRIGKKLYSICKLRDQ
ncbi:U6 snRNA phosphodiesterase, partial [Asparagus officinalis]|uniref:U6 snRNA phosphodiesterase n=1 Tax=Asparagus officinalis TaxID=4686 RepID=UPI00098E3608